MEDRLANNRALMLAALLAGCGGGQLAELEEEQAELRKEYDDLEENVEALKQEMIGLGLITEAQANARVKPNKGAKAKVKAGGPPGKRPKRPGTPRPETELSEALPWTAERTGTPDPLPAIAKPERAEGACGWRIKLEQLQPVSDFPLNRDGFGKSGPVVLLEDGEPMLAHAMPGQFADQCSGAFRHAGYLFLFSPTGTVDDGGTRSYTLGHAPEFPLPRGEDDRPMYWVYPGTTATFTFTEGWQQDWGTPELTLAGRTMDPVDGGTATFTAPGIEQVLDDGNFTLTQTLDLGDEGFSLTLSSPKGGPWVLIDTLTLGNPEFAVVVTAEAAWASREP